MSLCFNSSYLYLSTCALSSSICCLSLSSSPRRPSYSYRIALCFSSKALLNCGVSSIFLPPWRSWELSVLIFSSRRFFSSFSLMNSLLLASSAATAACLSSSARFFYCSSRRTASESTMCLLRYSSSSLSFLSSSSYFLRRARWSRSSLIRASFLTFLARVANFKVDKDSAKES